MSCLGQETEKKKSRTQARNTHTILCLDIRSLLLGLLHFILNHIEIVLREFVILRVSQWRGFRDMDGRASDIIRLRVRGGRVCGIREYALADATGGLEPSTGCLGGVADVVQSGLKMNGCGRRC
jgi:hypothetical protein